ncbi:amidohydrolase family protein [Anaerolineales bacterium HSG24]|nr:amidohydrolase family protein [Anaerolineales bacterium HSG24]
MTQQSCDILLSNGYLVTMNDEMHIYPQGSVAISGNKIVGVGETVEIETQFQAETVIDCTGCVISPGLINAHTHAPMTLLRGLADDLRLDVWLYGYIMPVEREFVDQNFCYTGTLLACAEMLRSGVTSFCDMYYNEAEVARATAKAGMRAILGQTILKFPSPDATNYDESIEYCRHFIEDWRDHGLIIPAVAPHAPYTSTPDMLRACVDLAKEFDVPIHIHVAETNLEQENSIAQYELPVVPWLEEQGLFEAKVIAAHCVHLHGREMRAMKTYKAGVAHCPSSNLKLASGVARVQKMINTGLHVGIGTDGAASNNDLDMFEETRLAAFLQKGIFGDPTMLPAKMAWRLATIEGARALHIGDITGSLEVGKRADITIVEVTNIHQMPNFARDPEAIYSQLVYATRSSDVRDVLVDGKILMRERELLTLNETEILDYANRISRRIDAFLIAREGNILSKLLAISADFIPQETFEIQVKVSITDTLNLTSLIEQAGFKMVRPSIRAQYDTYLFFEDSDNERLRFREDEVKDQDGKLRNTFYTMTLMGPANEKEFDNSIMLTRARFTATARQSLRFYREYFRPTREQEVIKHRRRCHINHEQTDFAINLDEVADKQYLEIKCRTWSASDANRKAILISELLEKFGVKTDSQFKIEYLDLA